MEEKILEFGRLLRKGGLNVSLTQIADAARAAALVGFQPDDFYYALSCNLVCDQSELALFDKLFRLYFLTLPAAGQPEAGQIPPPEQHLSETARSVEGQGAGRGAGGSPALMLVKAVVEGNTSLLEYLAQVAFNSLGKISREELGKIDDLVVRAKVSIGWYMAVNHLEQIRVRERVGEVTYGRWQQRLQFLERRIQERLEDYFVSNFREDALEEIADLANLNKKDFERLTSLEVEEIRKRLTRLARKLASRYSRRYRRAKRGAVDIRRTVRHALGTGGKPVRLKYRQKVVSRPDLVLLCDVSGSVAAFSEFMLQLVYTIQNRFRSVRSFLFVDDIAEVTSYFKNEDIDTAIQDAFTKTRFANSGFSDYGKVFTLFANRYLSGLSRRSTLIILGDARNNYNLDERDFLQKISDQVGRVLWFNPQPRQKWDSDDSIMKVYAPYCRQVFECRNLVQFEELIEAII